MPVVMDAVTRAIYLEKANRSGSLENAVTKWEGSTGPFPS